MSDEERARLSKSMKAAHARRRALGLPHRRGTNYRANNPLLDTQNDAQAVTAFALALKALVRAEVEAVLRERFSQ
jgi:hypothetical protein